MSQLTAADFGHLARVELARLSSVAPEHLTTPLPHIDGWTVHSVVGHTGWVCRYADLCLRADAGQPPARAEVAEPPAGPDVLAWFEESRQILLAQLEAIDPDRIVPTWTGPQRAIWWMRRMAQEASMHRWDAFAATGSPEPIDSALARDGIDEVLDVFAPHRLQFATLGASGESIHLHATDIADGEWMIRIDGDRLEWSHAHEKGDVAARGPVSDLLLMLWSRIPPTRLEVFGDSGLLDRWQDAATF